MSIKRGDIILVPFPFTDFSSIKVRPAVIVSPDPQSSDILIAFISSVVPSSFGKTEFLLSSDNSDFAPTGLKKTSVFKMNKLLTVSSALTLRRLGAISPTLQKELDKCLKEAIGIE